MAGRVGEAFYDLDANDSGLRRKLAGARDDITRTGRQAEGGFLRGVSGGLGAFGSTLAGVTRAAAGASLIVGGLGAVGAGFAIKGAAQMERYNVQWEVLLGSAEAAQDRMAELRQFAATTPFEIPQIVEASRTLQVFTDGALATGEGLRLVGDIAAGTTGDINSTAMWIGRLYDALENGQPFGEAAMRLQEMGALSGDGRRRLEELAESVKTGGMTMEEAWATAAGEFEQFSGLMEAQSQTFEGQWSNLMDNLGQTFAEVGAVLLPGAKAMLDAFNGALPGIKAFLVDVFEAAKPALDAVVEAIGEVVFWVGAIIRNIGDLEGYVGDDSPLGWFASIWLTIQEVVSTVLPPIFAAIMEFVETIVGAVMDNWPAISEVVTNVFGVVRDVITTVAPLVSEALAFIGREVLPPLLEAFNGIATWVSEHWPQIASIIEKAAGIIGTVVSALWPIIEFGFSIILPALGAAFEALLPIIETVLDVVAGVIDFFVEDFNPAIEEVGAIFGAVWEGVASFFTDLWNGLLRFFGGIVAGIIGLVGDVVGVVAEIPGPFQEGAREAKKALDGMEAEVRNWGTTTSGTFKGTYEDHRRQARSAGANTLSAYGAGFLDYSDELAANVGASLNGARAVLAAFSPPRHPLNPLRNIGRDAAATAMAYGEAFAAQGDAIARLVGEALGRANEAVSGARLGAVAVSAGEVLSASRSEVVVRHELTPGAARELRDAGFNDERVAGLLASGVDALGLVRNLNHAASIRGAS